MLHRIFSPLRIIFFKTLCSYLQSILIKQFILTITCSVNLLPRKFFVKHEPRVKEAPKNFLFFFFHIQNMMIMKIPKGRELCVYKNVCLEHSQLEFFKLFERALGYNTCL